MKPTELNEIAKRLKALRTEKQLSLQELADKTGLTKSTLQRYETGNIGNIPLSKIDILAKGLGVNPHTILGWDNNIDSIPESIKGVHGIIPLPTGKRIPIIGSIACGSPILAQENIEGYLSLNPDDSADFCLVCKGDSMLPRCQNGDLVLIRKQPTVENGEIAAVRIGDEATLKKVYRPAPDQLMLIAENSDFPPIVLTKDEINTVSIEGKAIGFIRMF